MKAMALYEVNEQNGVSIVVILLYLLAWRNLTWNFEFSDLIAVSSTVIPLLEYQNGNSNETHHNHHPSPFSEEYKLAYMKHFHKKAVDLEPDTLITSKYYYWFAPSLVNWLEIVVYFSEWKESDQE